MRTPWRRWSVTAAVLVLGFAGVYAAGQSKGPATTSVSDLERQNMTHVAARPTQLVAIFYRDPGLLVEFKRWVAKDAADHGQLVSDADLSDEAIFNRLETDVVFRSQATQLVQKYGYLLPELNPESSMAREHALLVQDRIRLQAQNQESTNARQQPQATQGSAENPPACPESGCAAQPNRPVPMERTDYSNPRINSSGQDGGAAGQLSTNGASSAFSAASFPADGMGATNPDETWDPLARQQSPGGAGSNNSYPQPDLGSASGSQASPTNWPAQGALSASGGAQSNELGPQPDLADDGLASVSRPRVEYQPVATTNVQTPRGLSDRQSSGQRLFLQPNPYDGIPSLFDMYLQASPRPVTPERFGMQIFENGTRDLQNIPMDLPVGPDYVVGPGDGLSISTWGGVSRQFRRIVDREGRINLPEIGPVLVAGSSLAQLQETIQDSLRKQFRDISADVSLSRLRTVRVYVVGDVVRPGAYDISSLSTPLNALFAAGGPTPRGSLRTLKHYRGSQLVQDVDTYDLLLHGVKSNMQRVEDGDSILVPPMGPQVTVEGMVRRPAIYERKGENSLSEVLALAGGLLPTATLRHVEVQRVVAHEKRTMISLDVDGTDDAAEINAKLNAFAVQDGDSVRIFPIAPFNQDSVYLDGHVIRPGKYSFHDGMRVTDLLASYKDILPEPAQYGEIIRLRSPDYRPQVHGFNLAAALANPANAPALQPLDTVHIFSRYDFENPPVVSVWGDVRVPGTYRTSGDIHISDAIHLAGGLAPDADSREAQVFRYLSDSSLDVFTVRLKDALAGDTAANVVLKSRDRILIHKNGDAVDPPGVYVKGNVVRPGRYPLANNMRISDLIRAAGGLLPSADTTTADLTHYEWENGEQITGKQEQIALASVLSGGANAEVHNGDVLAIRELPGWNDLGASITLRGEVVHPGTYGIRPGERLSSVVQRAGGFSPAAYAYGAVLTRLDVQQLEEKSYADTIQRVREQQTALKLASAAASDPDEKMSDESAYVQWRSTLDTLVNNPPSGRVTVQLSSNLRNWANTNRDITIRAGDVLTVPKRPSFVVVQGQVYGATALAYRPGKSARWYLNHAGGPTNLANKKAMFVIRADGTVIGGHSSLWSEPLSATLQPGDMVVVPEKALGGPPIWKMIFQNAQVLSSITTSAILAAKY